MDIQTITVVGLGYVGLPVACAASKAGLTVYGLDTDQSKVDAVNSNKSPLEEDYVKEALKDHPDKIKATTDPSCISDSHAVIICVPTPTTDDHQPDLGPVRSACQTVAQQVQNGTLVVIESTIYPGTTEEIVLPLFEQAGKKVLLAHCPERIDPGKKQWTVENIPRVVGGLTPEATAAAESLYQKFIQADITALSSVKAAEATKIMENTFRDVNIAFMNEMAKSFDKAGIDITEVIKGASTKPFAFMPHYPGAGVGGHCISVDPYYLISKAQELGFDHQFLKLARKINEGMPAYAVEQLESTGDVGTVAVLGLAYKADIDDDRESPSHDVLSALEQKKIAHVVYDPFVPTKSTAASLAEALDKADTVILVTDHSEFKEITADLLKQHNIRAIVDGRNCLHKESIEKAGISYRGIGR